jgi:6-phosphogluconolactonase
MPDVQRLANAHEVADAAARHAGRVLTDAIDRQGKAIWVLAGGTSPIAAYHIVVDRYADLVDWARVRLVIGDERMVPLDHTESNWGHIRPIFDGRENTAAIMELAPRVDLNPESAAADYESRVRSLSDDGGAPRLDLVWLGVGEDGHTLSLFPGHPDFRETDRLVVPVRRSPKPPPDRITLTLAALAHAHQVTVFAVGAGKRESLSRALNGEDLPIGIATRRAESNGAHVTWFFDSAASGMPEA